MRDLNPASTPAANRPSRKAGVMSLSKILCARSSGMRPESPSATSILIFRSCIASTTRSPLEASALPTLHAFATRMEKDPIASPRRSSTVKSANSREVSLSCAASMRAIRSACSTGRTPARSVTQPRGSGIQASCSACSGRSSDGDELAVDPAPPQPSRQAAVRSTVRTLTRAAGPFFRIISIACGSLAPVPHASGRSSPWPDSHSSAPGGCYGPEQPHGSRRPERRPSRLRAMLPRDQITCSSVPGSRPPPGSNLLPTRRPGLRHASPLQHASPLRLVASLSAVSSTPVRLVPG